MRANCFLIVPFLCAFCYFSEAQNKTALKDSTINLKEVEVRAKYIKHEPGMDIVDAVQLRKGKTNLVDLLQDVPGVLVTDDKISIVGTGGVKVMFNGRLKTIPSDVLMGYLKSRPASNVKTIEVIKNPGAKYDAEGQYGMLNIITEKRVDYIGGEVGDDLTYARRWMNALRGNLNYSHKRVTASLNSSWNYGKSIYWERNSAFYPDMMRHGSSTASPRRNNLTLNGSLDIMLDSLSTLGLEAYYGPSYTKNSYVNTTNTFDNSGKLAQTEQAETGVQSPDRNLNLSFYIDRNWSRGNSISLMVDVFNFKHNRDNGFVSHYFENGAMLDDVNRVQSTSEANLKGASFMLDYVVPIPWSIKMKTGLKGSFTTTDNSLFYEVSTLPAQNNVFTYDENIYAAYVSFDKRLDKFKFVLGGRYEYTQSTQKPETGGHIERTEGHFFPNAQIGYEPNRNVYFSLSTRSWVNRPSIQALNPFETYINTNSMSKGNPLINPSYGFNIQLSSNFSFKGNELTVNLRHSRQFRNIAQIIVMDASTGMLVSQWRNAFRQYGDHLDIYYTLNKWRWMRAQFIASANYGTSKANSSYTLKSEHSFHPMAYTNLRFFFDRKRNLSAYANASYTGKSKDVSGTLDPTYNLGCGVVYSCLSNRLNMKLGLNNLLECPVKGTAYSNDGMKMEFNNKYRNRTVLLSMSYSFGKEIRTKQRQSSSEDILDRF